MKIILLLLLLAGIAKGEDLHFTQSGAGSHDGSSVGNAWSTSEASTAANWGSGAGKVSAGDTLWVNGTITSALTIQGDGTPGSVITIKFAAAAKFSAAAWASTGAILVGGRDHITIDGGTDGLMENTANGTGLANQVDSSIITASSANSLTVQNLIITNVYIRTIGTEQNGYGTAIEQLGTFTNYVVNNCRIHHAYIGITGRYDGSCRTVTWTSNLITRCNWGARMSDTTAASFMDGFTFGFNTVSNCGNWDDTSINSFHHNGCYIWAESGGYFTNSTFTGNTFGPGWGDHTTGGIFQSGQGMIGPALVMNNLFICETNVAPSNGSITWQNGGGFTGRIFNNTFIGGGDGRAIYLNVATAGAETVWIYNNIFQNQTSIALFSLANITLSSDNNVFWNLRANEGWYAEGFETSLANWQGLGYDPNSVTTSPNLDGSWLQVPTSSAIDGGTNVSSYVTTDRIGTSRPQNSVFDAGMFEYVVIAGTTQSATIGSGVRIKTSRR